MIGRFVGTALMSVIAPRRLLALFSVAALALMLYAITGDGLSAVVALMFVNFFLSIMFPTIFALGTKGLGDQVKLGSSLIIMAIVGGALLPPLLGWFSDQYSLQAAYVIPVICFSYILYYAGWGADTRSLILDPRS